MVVIRVWGEVGKWRKGRYWPKGIKFLARQEELI
jgi:hypothetical protein